MARWFPQLSVCVLAAAVTLSAQNGSGRQGGDARRQELQQARQTLQQHVTEARRLEDQIKRERKQGDREGVTRDSDALKMTRTLIRQDQDRVRSLQAERPNGRGQNPDQGRSGGRNRGSN